MRVCMCVSGLIFMFTIVQCSIIINDTFDTIWATVVSDLVSTVFCCFGCALIQMFTLTE